MIEEKDVYGKVLYEDDNHKYIWLGTENKYRKGVIQTMQYLIIDNGRGTCSIGRSPSFFTGRRFGKPIHLDR